MSVSLRYFRSENKCGEHLAIPDVDDDEPIGHGYSVVFLDPCELKPSEHHCKIKAGMLLRAIRKAGVWTTPILADRDTLTVMDGHHRLAASLRMGLRAVPAVLLSYSDPRLAVGAWRDGAEVSPAAIRLAASSGRLLPYKTTRHILDHPLPDLRLPLDGLV